MIIHSTGVCRFSLIIILDYLHNCIPSISMESQTDQLSRFIGWCGAEFRILSEGHFKHLPGNSAKSAELTNFVSTAGCSCMV